MNFFSWRSWPPGTPPPGGLSYGHLDPPGFSSGTPGPPGLSSGTSLDPPLVSALGPLDPPGLSTCVCSLQEQGASDVVGPHGGGLRPGPPRRQPASVLGLGLHPLLPRHVLHGPLRHRVRCVHCAVPVFSAYTHAVTVFSAYTAPSPCSVRTLRSHRVQCMHCVDTVLGAWVHCAHSKFLDTARVTTSLSVAVFSGFLRAHRGHHATLKTHLSTFWRVSARWCGVRARPVSY